MKARIISLCLILVCVVFSGVTCLYEERGRGWLSNANYIDIYVYSSLDIEASIPSYVDTEVDYPGVTAERIIDRVSILPGSVSPDGQKISFYVVNESTTRFPCVWMVIKKVVPQVELFSEPDAINRNNEEIFVFGPLDPGGRSLIELEFLVNVFESYGFQIDILSISPRLVLTADPDDPVKDDLYSVDSSGGDLFQITEGYTRNVHASWSPGNERLAFESFEVNGKFQIYTVHPDGSHIRRVTSNLDYSALKPTFSPDGKHLLYVCEGRAPGAVMDICINSVKGGEERVVISGAGWYTDKVFWPSWSPDGENIIYYARPVARPNRFYFFLQRIDPRTLELNGAPVRLNELYEGPTPATSSLWCALDSEINWSPDSSHGAALGRIFQRSGGWVLTYQGALILNIRDMIEDGPAVYTGYYATTLNHYNKFFHEVKSPSFHPLDDFLSYQHNYIRVNETELIINIMLDADHQPVDLEEITLLEMKDDKMMTPEWPPLLLPGFYR